MHTLRKEPAKMGGDWNPIAHLNSVNSVADAKREWPWLAGTATLILGVFGYAAYKWTRR